MEPILLSSGPTRPPWPLTVWQAEQAVRPLEEDVAALVGVAAVQKCLQLRQMLFLLLGAHVDFLEQGVGGLAHVGGIVADGVPQRPRRQAGQARRMFQVRQQRLAGAGVAGLLEGGDESAGLQRPRLGRRGRRGIAAGRRSAAPGPARRPPPAATAAAGPRPGRRTRNWNGSGVELFQLRHGGARGRPRAGPSAGWRRPPA